MFRDYAEEKRHDEWKTGNYGQGWEDEEEIEDDLCGNCNGSGEGYADGTRCSVCKGKGAISTKEAEDDEEYYEWDDEIDENFETLETEREK